MIPRSSPPRWSAIVLAVVLASPWTAFAASETAAQPPAGTGRIKARIYGIDGKTPVEGAILRGHHLDSGAVYSSARTSKSGECELSGLPFGYLDISVETAEGTFVGNQVINVPPSGIAALSFTLAKYSDRGPAWWGGKPPRDIPGTRAPSQGVAEIRQKPKGREFWTSPKGIAVIGGTGAALLLLLASGGDSSSSASPSTP